MESRYVIVGLIIIVLAASFMVYGVIVLSDRIVGVALSVSTIGIVITVIGINYSEPAENMLREYSVDLEKFMTKIIEDMGIIGGHKIKLCYVQKALLYSDGDIPCSNVIVGIGMVSRAPYIAIPVEGMLSILQQFTDLGNLVDKLKKVFVDILAVCRGITVSTEDEMTVVELVDLTNRGINYIRTPINPVRLYLITTLALHYSRDIEVVEEAMTYESYKIKVRLGDTIYG